MIGIRRPINQTILLKSLNRPADRQGLGFGYTSGGCIPVMLSSLS